MFDGGDATLRPTPSMVARRVSTTYSASAGTNGPRAPSRNDRPALRRSRQHADANRRGPVCKPHPAELRRRRGACLLPFEHSRRSNALTRSYSLSRSREAEPAGAVRRDGLAPGRPLIIAPSGTSPQTMRIARDAHARADGDVALERALAADLT